jgi:hypothetical protein
MSPGDQFLGTVVAIDGALDRGWALRVGPGCGDRFAPRLVVAGARVPSPTICVRKSCRGLPGLRDRGEAMQRPERRIRLRHDTTEEPTQEPKPPKVDTMPPGLILQDRYQIQKSAPTFRLFYTYPVIRMSPMTQSHRTVLRTKPNVAKSQHAPRLALVPQRSLN